MESISSLGGDSVAGSSLSSLQDSKEPKSRARFTEEEDQQIEEGFQKLGCAWEDIVKLYNMSRTATQIKGRHARIKRRKNGDRRSEVLVSPPPPKKQKLNLSDDQFSIIESLESSLETVSYNLISPPPNQASRVIEGKENHPKPSYETLKEILVELSVYQMKELQQKVLRDDMRLGGVRRHGKWKMGKEFLHLQERQQKIEQKRSELEAQKKEIKTALSKQAKMEITPEIEAKKKSLDLRNELNRINTALLRKEESEVTTLRLQLNSERMLHELESKMVKEHNESIFSDHRVLEDRYVLLNLLGKGGFSHVYAAFDLKLLIKVACKIHLPDSSWSEQRKKSYIHHATRECHIQKAIDYPRVVKLSDVFLLDDRDSFCTILEYCNDGDLDLRMRKQQTFSEKETRCILMQVIDAVSHLNHLDKPIIHYDLKPGNILFHNGEVKISDFGLSKIMENSDDTAMDLTSQGAGTYWYLPPECFVVNSPKITSKVDVWSIGVLCYQMLFGKKPFANNMAPLQIVQNQVINDRCTVEFPSTKVSINAKNFIKSCLATDLSKRPDIDSLAKHHFVAL